jgi:hypothetical protein
VLIAGRRQASNNLIEAATMAGHVWRTMNEVLKACRSVFLATDIHVGWRVARSSFC